MCGIVGYIGFRQTVPILMKGLERLEYRGYDSAGLACLRKDVEGAILVKEKGKLGELKKELQKHPINSSIGIGHTRWATHGEPSRTNAHPHFDHKNKLVLVHNGIIENFHALKEKLKKKDHRFYSGTDTEVAVNYIASFYKGSTKFIDAFSRAIRDLEGYFAFVAMDQSDPSRLYVFKRANPLVIGVGNGEHFVASDTPALLPFTKKVIYLEDDEYAVLTKEKVEIFNLKSGRRVKRNPVLIKWSLSQAQKGGYPHFMLKEIHEQPAVLQEAIHRVIDKKENIFFDTLDSRGLKRLDRIRKVFFVSCGTAYHASLVGSLYIEKHAGLATRVQVASEFRYQNPVVGRQDLVVLVSQSGETADTLAALKEAKSKGALTLAVVNVLGSTIAREADFVIYTHAGPEIGVASTKAYTAQLITLYFLSLYLGRSKGVLTKQKMTKLVNEIRKLPKACSKILKQTSAIKKCAKKNFRRQSFLYLGRGVNFPTALEGALKLKEISYAHAHGYAAGEMKHGPIALVDKNQPVICIASKSSTYHKMVSNVQEIRARKGIIIVVGTEGDKELKKIADDFFAIPDVSEELSPLLTVVVLQYLAYLVSVLNKRDVDQPRNLAKSVTVE